MPARRAPTASPSRGTRPRPARARRRRSRCSVRSRCARGRGRFRRGRCSARPVARHPCLVEVDGPVVGGGAAGGGAIVPVGTPKASGRTPSVRLPLRDPPLHTLPVAACAGWTTKLVLSVSRRARAGACSRGSPAGTKRPAVRGCCTGGAGNAYAQNRALLVGGHDFEDVRLLGGVRAVPREPGPRRRRSQRAMTPHPFRPSAPAQAHRSGRSA